MDDEHVDTRIHGCSDFLRQPFEQRCTERGQ